MMAKIERRLAAPEARAKSPMISSWVDFMTWMDEHENDVKDLEVKLNPELGQLISEA